MLSCRVEAVASMPEICAEDVELGRVDGGEVATPGPTEGPDDGQGRREGPRQLGREDRRPLEGVTLRASREQRAVGEPELPARDGRLRAEGRGHRGAQEEGAQQGAAGGRRRTQGGRGHGSILGSGVVPGGGERRSHSGPTVISIRRILLLCML